MLTAGLIVAAGRGSRLGGALPKQYQPLGPHPVLRHAVAALLAHPAVGPLQIVIHPGDRDLCAATIAGLAGPRLLPPVAGAGDRSGSVLAGLEALAPHAPDRVLIHDAARPFLAAELVTAVLAALDDAPAVLPALPVVDALWRAADGAALEPVARDALWRAQTPQGFRFADILAAHRAHRGAALDDAAVARAAGLEVRIVPGDEANFKITTAADLARARRRIGGAMDIRTGNGFDVHAFGPGNGVTLCGVLVPFDRGLVGHSDADVGLHALTDRRVRRDRRRRHRPVVSAHRSHVARRRLGDLPAQGGRGRRRARLRALPPRLHAGLRGAADRPRTPTPCAQPSRASPG